MGYTVVDAPTVAATHLGEILTSHAAALLGRRELQEPAEDQFDRGAWRVAAASIRRPHEGLEARRAEGPYPGQAFREQTAHDLVRRCCA